MTIRISSAYHGRMLRSYLKLTLGLSTAALSRLKNHPEGILVNGKRVTVRYVLSEGAVLELDDKATPETATAPVIPTELPLSILYEDDFVTVMNKPPYMPTHPSHGHLTDTLANALAWRYQTEGEPFVFRPLGRLDRNTSGIVVVGKTQAASGILGRSLQAGEVTKRYLALVCGTMPVDGRLHTLKTFVYRPESCGIRRAVCDADTEGAELAVTAYRVLATNERMSLVLAEPMTGRTHQLRVHFSHLGHPILGDDIYGCESELIGRHALHAVSLSFPLPFLEADSEIAPDTAPLNRPTPDGRLHTWAPVFEDMQALIDREFPSFSLTAGELPTVGDLRRLDDPDA